LPSFFHVTRRTFLRLAGLTSAAAAGVGAYATVVEPHWVEVVRRPLPIRNLPVALAGRTLAQISDIHVGTQVDDDYVISSFERIASIQPDIVVVTGDFISYHRSTFEQILRIYRHFPKGRLATLATLGNHDYGRAWSHAEIADRLVESVSPLGIKVLRNTVQDVDGLQIAGLDDFWGTNFKPYDALGALDSTRASLVLSHNPDTADLAIWGDYRGWILSGHTHGGQCKAPFLPPPLLPVRNKRYTAGEFALADGRRVYINRGLGHLLPIRFNVRPEITVFELVPA
jgi:predicted MPP superfamily phosphohydrolase